MTTTAVRMYGKTDLRLERFDLPAPGDDEILAHIVSDSLCMSSYKAAVQGSDHKRVPADIDRRPVMVGHEFCGQIVSVGAKWQHAFEPGQRFIVQPALNYRGSLDAPGYSYRYIGGDATYIVIPNEVMEMDCLLPYEGDAYYFGSLTEPVSCIVGAFRAAYHCEQGSYDHRMGIVDGGAMAILAGAGPMGLGAIDLAIGGTRRPARLVVTDIDAARLARAEALFPPEAAAAKGIELTFVNTAEVPDPPDHLRRLAGGSGFDDVLVMAPVRAVVEQADRLLAAGGCLNFFAGPTDPEFRAELNLYDVHYAGHRIVGTSGGNTEDMRIALEMMSSGKLDPSMMITHVGGLDAVAPTTLSLPRIPGGKKLIYTNVSLPLTAIADFARLGAGDPLFAELAELVADSDGIWNAAAEAHLLARATPID